ncbi:hypothetical protein ACVVIH_20600 [Chryseobacterium arthrosphaerae]|uniref:hypothetical protein n=1 Tax=Chryseobacterium arthrosphaerae TaxID=651561 RepID=UPI003D325C3E
MKTKYIKVSVSDRVPEKSGFYYTFSTSGIKETVWFINDSFSYVSPSFTPQYWLDEVPDYEEETYRMLDRIQDLNILPEEIEDELSLLLKKLKS